MFSTPVPSRHNSKRPGASSAGTPRVSPNTLPRSALSPGQASKPVDSRFTSQSTTSRLNTPLPIRNAASNRKIVDLSRASDAMETDYQSKVSEAEELYSSGTFAQRPELSVFLFDDFPLEVQQILRSADFYRDVYRGVIDATTGYAVLLSASTCFVWNCSKRSLGSATCYIFPAPSSGSAGNLLLPVSSLVAYGPSREPGLILCSATGSIRFWETIVTGLSGAERFHTAQASLMSDEFITSICSCEPLLHILATTSGRLFRLTISSAGGKSSVVITPFTRSQSVLSRVTSTFFSGSAVVAEGGEVTSVVAGQGNLRDGRDVWVLTERDLQKWKVSSGSWEQLELEVQIRDSIEEELATIVPNISRGQELDVELLDIGLTTEDLVEDVVVLVSFKDSFQVASSTSQRSMRSYAVVRFGLTGGTVKALKTNLLSYHKDRDPRPASKPRLSLLDRGSVVFVQFSDAVSVMSISEGATFQSTLSLKDPWDRLLGFGHIAHEERRNLIDMTVMTAGNGLLNFRLDLAEIRNSHPDTPTDQLKSTMEQAVFFGSLPENPFLFRFEPPFIGNLDLAAERLSHDILTSSCEFLRPVLDLTAQLADRETRLLTLIRFINEHGALSHLSQASRQRLALDASKLHAATNLWAYHNRPSRELGGWDSGNLLVRAIENYMQGVGEGYGEDPVRLFFRTKVPELNVIFREVAPLVQQATQTSSSPSEWSATLLEANRIFINMYQSMYQHQTQWELYGFDRLRPLVFRWTSESAQLDILQYLFETTVQLLSDIAPPQNPSDPTFDLYEMVKGQMRDIAAIMLSAFQEREDLLVILMKESGNEADQAEFDALQNRFDALRPHVYRPLVRYGFSDAAFAHAEEWQDFTFLAELCNTSGMGNDTKTQYFLRKFGEPFAFELYRWFIEHGQTRLLLDDRYNRHLSAFFKQNPHPRIQWLHSLASDHFTEASAALSEEATKEQRLESKHVILSIAKLCESAQFSETTEEVSSEPLSLINESLDLVSVQDKLGADLQNAITLDVPTAQSSPDRKAERAANIVSSSLAERPAFLSLFQRLAKRLFQGDVLSGEDLVDMLTLKGTADDGVEEYGNAISVLWRTKDLPEARKVTSLRNIWRRVLIRDNWNALRATSHMNDEELHTALRQKALYSTIQTIFADHIPQAYILSPEQVVQIPTSSEIDTRFPGLTANQTANIERDYMLESTQLVGLIKDCGLPKWFEQVVLLAKKDQMEGEYASM